MRKMVIETSLLESLGTTTDIVRRVFHPKNRS